MKKIYLSAAAVLACTLMSAQTPFWQATSYKGAFPITDNTPATDWLNLGQLRPTYQMYLNSDVNPR